MGLFGKSNDQRLLEAAQSGDLEAVRSAWDRGGRLRGANADWRDDEDGNTALHHAARCGYAAVVELLLQRGADTEHSNKFGRTPLLHAALNGHTPVVALLLEHGGVCVDAADSLGWTPLQYAAFNGDVAVAAALLDRGAHTEAQNTFGRTPLLHAAHKGHVALVQLLLERGASAAAVDHDGKTALDVAKDDATRAMLRNMPNAAAAIAAAAAEAESRRAAAAAHAAAEAAEARQAAEARAAEALAAAAGASRREAAADAGVPDDVAALLRGLSLSSHGAALCDKLGVARAADLRHVTDALLRAELPAMRPVERAKLLAAVAPPAAAPAAAAADACDVMLSYRVSETGSGGDRSVQALQAALQRRGYSVFVGESAIEGGANWPITIQRAVQDCRAFVILCSPTYGHAELSPWTLRELVLAGNLSKPLLPVWHSGPYPPPEVVIYLSGTQRIPSGEHIRAGYVQAGVAVERVAEELAKALASRGVMPSCR